MFKRVKIEIELYILSAFHQRDLHYMFFKYINKIFVLPNIEINFIDFLKDVYFVKIFRIYVDVVFCNDIRNVFRDLYTEVRRYKSYWWLLDIGSRIGRRFFVQRIGENVLFGQILCCRVYLLLSYNCILYIILFFLCLDNVYCNNIYSIVQRCR